ncbi:MAG TPA: hypothetical protein VGD96_02265 [Bradyrhizobium sp.]
MSEQIVACAAALPVLVADDVKIHRKQRCDAQDRDPKKEASHHPIMPRRARAYTGCPNQRAHPAFQELPPDLPFAAEREHRMTDRVPSPGRSAMLREEQVAVLRDIAQSIAFADDMQGEVDKLIREGYVAKDGDLYELTPKAQKLLSDRAAGLNQA